jgi:hypothetical protein
MEPLTWLPGELNIAGTPLYASANVSGLGFISMENKIPQSSFSNTFRYIVPVVHGIRFARFGG